MGMKNKNYRNVRGSGRPWIRFAIRRQALTASQRFAQRSTGLPKEAAIPAITSAAAKIAGIDKLVGDIAVGRLADLVITDGDPLEIMTDVKMTIIGGKVVYNKM